MGPRFALVIALAPLAACSEKDGPGLFFHDFASAPYDAAMSIADLAPSPDAALARDASAMPDLSVDAGAAGCKPPCGPGTVCVRDQINGGAVLLPTDGGVCPQGTHLQGDFCQR